eukprot:scaffold241454_cov18-Tisochrysis_lutea.AAC.1
MSYACVHVTCPCLQGLDYQQGEPLAGLHVLDVGCGGGILSESMARLGAQVHGIDITEENTRVASQHAALDPLLQSRIRLRSLCVSLRCVMLASVQPMTLDKYGAGKRSACLACMEVLLHLVVPACSIWSSCGPPKLLVSPLSHGTHVPNGCCEVAPTSPSQRQSSTSVHLHSAAGMCVAVVNPWWCVTHWYGCMPVGVPVESAHECMSQA